jgi:hypothetical protein
MNETCHMRVNCTQEEEVITCGREACAKVEMDYDGEAVKVSLCRVHANQMAAKNYNVRFEE